MDYKLVIIDNFLACVSSTIWPFFEICFEEFIMLYCCFFRYVNKFVDVPVFFFLRNFLKLNKISMSSICIYTKKLINVSV